MRNKIKRLFKRSVDSLTKIVIGGATVLCTPGHNIYANDSYIRAADLSVEDSVYTSSGNYERIDEVSTFDTTATVYNIEVEGNHNYFVSGRNLLVHNNCGWLTLKNTEDLSQSTFNQFTNNLINIGPEITVAQRKDFYDAINTLTPAQRSAFLNDFGDNAEALTDFISDLGLVDAWKYLDEAGVDETLRRNIDALTDPEAALEAIQISQKVKPTWPEIQALFKRGNDFNRKVRNQVPNPYQYYEVTVEKTLSNGTVKRYRLDSYNPGSDIVSRKATDFDNIQTSTFQNYISELKSKYQTGLKIVKPGTPIDGQTLQGAYKLEVPKSNLNSSKLTDFQQIASDNGVEIIFIDEF